MRKIPFEVNEHIKDIYLSNACSDNYQIKDDEDDGLSTINHKKHNLWSIMVKGCGNKSDEILYNLNEFITNDFIPYVFEVFDENQFLLNKDFKTAFDKGQFFNPYEINDELYVMHRDDNLVFMGKPFGFIPRIILKIKPENEVTESIEQFRTYALTFTQND
ncbi:hypothetical protein H9660_13865 [Clostridium sp. Sa3CUN1]|uniref:Uncharacterized protein n=1 Tax=Clostridium gallinarum TaxID=2762246 RepID=A0ABR8Q726_9CLOT|nr:hypothetical protein [Clostridium gallinarum]MBD7916232.1 hypothetical protein [Clostridium gallinarum]